MCIREPMPLFCTDAIIFWDQNMNIIVFVLTHCFTMGITHHINYVFQLCVISKSDKHGSCIFFQAIIKMLSWKAKFIIFSSGGQF